MTKLKITYFLILLTSLSFAVDPSQHLTRELSFDKGIGVNLANQYLNMNTIDSATFIVVNTNIPFTQNQGMTSLRINYWGYGLNWEMVVGWYVYNNSFFTQNGYIVGIHNHNEIQLFQRNGKICVAIPRSAVGQYGNMTVHKDVGGIGFPTDWQKNWSITSGEIGANFNAVTPVTLKASVEEHQNMATHNLHFALPRQHDLNRNDLSFMNGKVGIGTNSPSSALHIKSDSEIVLTLETKNNKISQTDYGNPSKIQFIGGTTDKVFLFGRHRGGFSGTENFGFSNGKRSIVLSDNKVLIGGTSLSEGILYGEIVQIKPSLGVEGNTKFYKNVEIIGDLTAGESNFKKNVTVSKTLLTENIVVTKTIKAANSSFKVEEDGHVKCTEITVAMGPFPDYVFSDKYKLKSLTDVNKYISENKKLPNMPSAEDVGAQGGNLGELTRLQQEKIEELTLYTIEQQNLIQALNKRLSLLEDILKK